MSQAALGDELGPRGRARVRIVSAVAAVVLAALVAGAVKRLADKQQFEAAKWSYLVKGQVPSFLLKGAAVTVQLAVVAMALSLVVGAILALGRLTRPWPLRWLSSGWVQFFRATPVLLLLLFSARGLPKLRIDLPGFWYVVVGLTLYNGAVLGEILRAGILSLDRGQSEASYALGMTYGQAMRLVIVPQAVRRMVPAIVSQLVTLLKDTTLASIIPYFELLRRGEVAAEEGKNQLQVLLVVALIYIAINLALSSAARWLEERQRRRYRAGAIEVTGIEAATVGAGPGTPTPTR